MFSGLEFYIVEAFRSFRRSTLMNVVAIVTITVSLTVFGGFLLALINMGNIIGSVSARLDLVAYSNRDLSLDDAAALQIKISKLPGVEKVEYTSKAEAWKKLREEFGEKLALGELVNDNPLPHTFSVRVRSPELLPAVAKEISGIEVIDEVRYSGKLIEQMKALISAVRVGGISMIVLLSLATLLIVVNTIRLTVLARETDIYIMKLVGATNNFVRWPFIIEGVMIGVIGGLSAFLVLKFSYDAVCARVGSALPFLPLVNDLTILTAVYATLIVGGTFLGMLGGYISVSRILKNEN
ncbi:MAG TPA: permease-like cell division protein FtsX [Candidatus Sulfotelmatobacter sp.]|nr:permease-like cell division protein FtsX [Candidatus Sulfotelmatobacter sp.]